MKKDLKDCPTCHQNVPNYDESTHCEGCDRIAHHVDQDGVGTCADCMHGFYLELRNDARSLLTLMISRPDDKKTRKDLLDFISNTEYFDESDELSEIGKHYRSIQP